MRQPNAEGSNYGLNSQEVRSNPFTRKIPNRFRFHDAREEEDARRPNRERENLVTERTRIVNQVKAILARFGIRTLRPTSRKAEGKLEGLCTAEGMPLLENTRAELCRLFARLCVVRSTRNC